MLEREWRVCQAWRTWVSQLERWWFHLQRDFFLGAFPPFFFGGGNRIHFILGGTGSIQQNFRVFSQVWICRSIVIYLNLSCILAVISKLCQLECVVRIEGNAFRVIFPQLQWHFSRSHFWRHVQRHDARQCPRGLQRDVFLDLPTSNQTTPFSRWWFQIWEMIQFD